MVGLVTTFKSALTASGLVAPDTVFKSLAAIVFVNVPIAVVLTVALIRHAPSAGNFPPDNCK